MFYNKKNSYEKILLLSYPATVQSIFVLYLSLPFTSLSTPTTFS